ncbi:sulfate/molybdate ABC transporter ATP-binding protein [Sporolactobacillus sp. CQH2019]|uniref:sulfate/molybdate ABC transporter ATP-binding protein n=1 Tax=Sporolactobacillus sp. CQH2019 TaxID=3023512 RepID=UPI0023686167|nr:sulfate/molybdate ABC transporter ATP-binding protein [Sporolactobacillus sp. CQH2019]MDD9149610.1 sulfate/molybdate ABC transporter ATP-binding protein [Sporolactobacillus sp. CQH2019]
MGIYVDIEKRWSSFYLKVKFYSRDNIVGLLGASGSGKSMTLKCLAGMITPDRGRIVCDDKTFFDSEQGINLPMRDRKVGFLFQNYALFPNMTVSQNIGFALNKLSRKEKGEIIREKMKMFDLQGLEKRFPNQLSGGQQQRVAIARALAINPGVLALDEPFSALDTHLRSKLEDKLADVLADYKGSTLFVSHNRSEIYHLCKSIVVINNGQVDTFGDRTAIFENPPTFAAALLTGCKNISKIKVLDSYTLEALDWGCTLKVAEKIDIQSNPGWIGIRAHFIEPAEDSDAENIVECQLNHVSEGPFNVAVYLENASKPVNGPVKLLRWEMEKEKWKDIKKGGQPWKIKLPAKNLFLISPHNANKG